MHSAWGKLFLVSATILFFAAAAHCAPLTAVQATVNGKTCEQITWTDSAGNPRTISVVTAHGASDVGGYLTQWTWYNGATLKTCNESDIVGGGVAGWSGFGETCSHNNSGGALCSKGDGSNATTTELFKGANHIIYRVDMDLTFAHVTWDYMVRTGADYFIYAITYSGYKSGVQNYDIRSPYCQFDWDGDGVYSATGVTGDSFAVDYKYFTTSAWPFTTWTWNTPATVPYVWEYKDGTMGDSELAYIQTQLWTEQDAGGGYQGTWSAPPSVGSVMPGDSEFTYQMNAYENWGSNKCTWMLGHVSSSLVGPMTAQYRRYNYSLTPPNLSGAPYQGYSLQILVDKYSAGGVAAAIKEEEDIHSKMSLTASIGTVATSGNHRSADPTTYTYQPAGYDHVYKTWKLAANNNAATCTLNCGSGGSLKNPMFQLTNYTKAGSPTGVSLNATPLVENTDYFCSVDQTGQKLYITFNRTLTGSNNIAITQTVDNTPPSAPGTVNDGTGNDISYTYSQTTLSANWGQATDGDSGISGYQYAIGTTAGGTEKLGWQTLGNVLTVTNSSLSLTVGTTYYFTVKAINGQGMPGPVASSNGQVVLQGVGNFTLTTAVNPAGAGSVALNPSGGTYTAGATVTLTATANTNYAFSSWSGGATGAVSPAVVTMNANTSVTANFTSTGGNPPPPVDGGGGGTIVNGMYDYADSATDSTAFVVNMGQAGSIILEVYTQTGKLVNSASQTANAGSNTFTISNTLPSGKRLAAGLYVYSLVATDNGGNTETRTGKFVVR